MKAYVKAKRDLYVGGDLHSTENGSYWTLIKIKANAVYSAYVEAENGATIRYGDAYIGLSDKLFSEYFESLEAES